MSQKARGPSRKKRAPAFKVGTNVVAPGGVLPGVGPFDELVVLRTHKDGTVDLVRLGGGQEFHRVAPRDLIHPE